MFPLTNDFLAIMAIIIVCSGKYEYSYDKYPKDLFNLIFKP